MANTPGVYGIDDVVSAYYAQGQDKNGNNESENNNNNNNDNNNNNSGIPEPGAVNQFLQTYEDNGELKQRWKDLAYHLIMTMKHNESDDSRYRTFQHGTAEEAYEAYSSGIPVIIESPDGELRVTNFTRYTINGYTNYGLYCEKLFFINEENSSFYSTLRILFEVSYDDYYNEWVIYPYNYRNATQVVLVSQNEYDSLVSHGELDPYTLYCIPEEESTDNDEENDGGK